MSEQSKDYLEHFIDEVTSAANVLGIAGSTLVQNAKAGGGGTWRNWVERKHSPTAASMAKVRAYIEKRLKSDDNQSYP